MKFKADLYYVMTNIPNFKSITQKRAEKGLENKILGKGNNCCKSRSSVTKLELDLCYVMTNSYTKLQVNISIEKSPENWSVTDRDQTKSPPASQ